MGFGTAVISLYCFFEAYCGLITHQVESAIPTGAYPSTMLQGNAAISAGWKWLIGAVSLVFISVFLFWLDYNYDDD